MKEILAQLKRRRMDLSLIDLQKFLDEIIGFEKDKERKLLDNYAAYLDSEKLDLDGIEEGFKVLINKVYL